MDFNVRKRERESVLDFNERERESVLDFNERERERVSLGF